MAHVLEDGVALDALEEVVGEGELLDVGHNVHARGMEQIEINVARRASARASDVKVPAPQGRIERFARVVNQRSRRLEQASKPVQEALSRHQRSA
jgi:hypothetical protein